MQTGVPVKQATCGRRTIGGVSSPLLLRRLALASLIANVALVVTGGAVRLTGSGLGCPTWPSCTDASYVTTAAMGVHGDVEFGNRVLGIVVGLLALACVVVAVAVRRRGPAPVGWAVLVLLGIPLQAVLGGITVLTKLNPWVVACHFLGSMAVLVAAYQLWLRSAPRPAPAVVARPLAQLVRVIVGVTAAVLVVGTVVTGSGPHAGDEHARRTGLDPRERLPVACRPGVPAARAVRRAVVRAARGDGGPEPAPPPTPPPPGRDGPRRSWASSWRRR